MRYFLFLLNWPPAKFLQVKLGRQNEPGKVNRTIESHCVFV